MIALVPFLLGCWALSSALDTVRDIFANGASLASIGWLVFKCFCIYICGGVTWKALNEAGKSDNDVKTSDAKTSPDVSKMSKDKIRELGEARLQQLKLKAKHDPLLAVHVGGSGIPIQTGSAFYLSCREGAFAISHAISDEEVELRYEQIKSIEVSGPGTEVTNAGLVGGGFGLEGALKGMAAAALVNAATTKKTTNTFLRIATNEGEAYFHFNNIEPAALRLVLSPVVVAVEANQGNTKSSAALGLASELEKLHQLKMNGVITDEEFEASKKKMITTT